MQQIEVDGVELEIYEAVEVRHNGLRIGFMFKQKDGLWEGFAAPWRTGEERRWIKHRTKDKLKALQRMVQLGKQTGVIKARRAGLGKGVE